MLEYKVKLYIERKTFEDAGYPAHHRVWKLFKDGSKSAVVEATWQEIPARHIDGYVGSATGVYNLKSGGVIMDDQAQEFPDGCNNACDECPDAPRCPDPF